MAKEMAETLSAIYGAYDQSDYESGIRKLETLEACDGLSSDGALLKSMHSVAGCISLWTIIKKLCYSSTAPSA